MKEKEIENLIIDWLNLQPGCFAFKLECKGTWNPGGGYFQKAGRNVPRGGSDIIFIRNGVFGALEVKTPKTIKKFHKNPGAHELRQQMFLQQVRDRGGIAAVVSSIEEVKTLFISLGAEIKSEQLLTQIPAPFL